MLSTATALAHPNIAFIKFWGLADEHQYLPANDSLSMNIGCLSTRTTVILDQSLTMDTLLLNGQAASGPPLVRVEQFLTRIRKMAKSDVYAQVISENNFPVGAGIASSASGFAALTIAAASAYHLSLTERELTHLARFGSGSACRSIPDGFVEWRTDPKTGESFALSIASADHWQLMDCIAILSHQHKSVGSAAGMRLANSSPLQAARVKDAPRRLDLCRQAILHRDFEALALVTELDSNLMHAVMMTSLPPLFYWEPASLGLIKAVHNWQNEGLPVTYTLDAGPNVHIICLPEALAEVLQRLRAFPDVIDVLKGRPAGPARLLSSDTTVSSQQV